VDPAAPSATRRIDLGPAADLEPGTMRLDWVDGTEPVLLVNLAGEIRAVQGVCSHEYFELDKGFLTGEAVTCALHLSRFDLATGDALDPPLAVYAVTVEDGRILVDWPEAG
jgi:nitrite reductase/ring-hydroxylating ferredoxin subunit